MCNNPDDTATFFHLHFGLSILFLLLYVLLSSLSLLFELTQDGDDVNDGIITLLLPPGQILH